MAGFDFSKVDSYVQNESNKISFLKLQEDGEYAKVRFMYGVGETFRGETVHNISEDPTKPRYVSCLREDGDPVDVCPLCANGTKITAQFFIPVYVQSIVTTINGVEQEQPVGQVMIFQRGATFKGGLQTVVRYTQDKPNVPIVSSLFRLVRNGKPRDPKTTYSVEYITTDNVTLEQLPPRPEVVGSYILPKLTKEEMIEKYINKTAQPTVQPTVSGIQPRTINANTFAGNSVGFNNQPVNNTNQAPVQSPQIGGGNVPF